jgi:dUTP pyrophosphatase
MTAGHHSSRRPSYDPRVHHQVRVAGPGALPEYGSAAAAGADLRASEAVTLQPGERVLVPTSLQLALPAGHVGLIWPRSGLAVRHGLDTLAGVIDADYRGEVRVALINHGTEPVTLHAGERIAQLLVQPVARVTFVRAESLDETARGPAGFGSTGTA